MKDAPIYKRGKAWYVRIPLGNSRYQHKSLGKITQREALDQAERLLAAPGSSALIDDVMHLFIADKLPKLKPSSRQVYVAGLETLADHVTGRRMSEVGHQQFKAWENALRKAGKSVSTIATYSLALSSFWSWAIAEGKATINAPKIYRAQSRQKSKGERIEFAPPRNRWLPESEEDRLLKACFDLLERNRGKRSSDWRMVADAIAFAIDTGLREQEQFGLRWSMVDMRRAELVIPKESTKTARERRIPLLRRSYEILKAIGPGKPDAYVFSRRYGHEIRRYAQMDAQLKQAADHAGLDYVRWHDLRRTCGCRLLQGARTTDGRKLRVEAVSKWLGHTSILTTQRVYAFLGVDNLHDEVGTADWLGGA